MHHFRVFISYARSDKGTVEHMDVLMREMGLIPVWDRDIPGGSRFDDGIRRRIAQSHVFMPLITPNSRDRHWVHQEIGYALGIGVPVVPVAVGALPEEMLSGIQAICVEPDMSELRTGIERALIESLVSDPEGELERLGVTTHIAEFSEERTRMLVTYAAQTPRPSRVRQRAIFSSFSLPDVEATDEVWDSIELREKRNRYFRTLLHRERGILGEHARAGGCSLIIYPFLDFSAVGPGVHRTQLKLLLKFLMSMREDMITVSTIEGSFLGNLTIIGDWFGAKALPPQPGLEYLQTVFSHHAPTVLRWIREFDKQLEDSLSAKGIEAHESRDRAVERIDALLRELPPE